MSPAIKGWLRKLQKFNQSLSVKLTFMYGGMMFLILIFTAFLAIGSVHYLLMRQLQFDVRMSARQTVFYLDHHGQVDASIFQGQNVLTYVNLVVYNDKGRPILDNIARYEPGEPLTPGQLRKLNETDPDGAHFEIIDTENELTYRYLKRWESADGRVYYLQFIRSAQRERFFIELLIRQILVTVLASLGVTILAGVVLTNKVLAPLRAMKEPLKHIEVNEMGYRIPLPESRDEQYELAVTINRTLDRIEHGVAQQRQFVSDASHELRTPITVINGYTDLLIRWGAQDPETLSESLAAIQAETEYMRQLIEHLLFIARASAGELNIRLRPLETSEIVREVWNGLQIADRQGPHHELYLAANESALIEADDALFKQLLRIFLDNAVKYTPEGRRIMLSATVTGAQYIVSIMDEGVGISETDLPNIFTRFYRVDSSRTKATGGTGLGLAIARDIIDMHHASIEVTSELGSGTTFTITFPLLSEDDSADISPEE